MQQLRKSSTQRSFSKPEVHSNSWTVWFVKQKSQISRCPFSQSGKRGPTRQVSLASCKKGGGGGLTASSFGSVLHAKRVTPPLLKRFLGEYHLSRVKAVQWGVNNEAEAVKAFTNLTGETVKETGIWLDGSEILGASPDGIVDGDSVLEVKCPYMERNMTIEEAVNKSPK